MLSKIQEHAGTLLGLHMCEIGDILNILSITQIMYPHTLRLASIEAKTA